MEICFKDGEDVACYLLHVQDNYHQTVMDEFGMKTICMAEDKLVQRYIRVV